MRFQIREHSCTNILLELTSKVISTKPVRFKLLKNQFETGLGPKDASDQSHCSTMSARSNYECSIKSKLNKYDFSGLDIGSKETGVVIFVLLDECEAVIFVPFDESGAVVLVPFDQSGAVIFAPNHS